MNWVFTKGQVEGIEKLFDFFISYESLVSKNDPTPFQLHHSIQGIDWKDGELNYSGVWDKNGWLCFYKKSLEVLMDTYWEINNQKNYQYDWNVKNRLNMLRKLRKNWNMSIGEYEKIYGITQ